MEKRLHSARRHSYLWPVLAAFLGMVVVLTIVEILVMNSPPSSYPALHNPVLDLLPFYKLFNG